MSKGRHASEQTSQKSWPSKRLALSVLSLLTVLLVVVGGSLALLVTQDDPIENVFKPAQVSCEVVESFDGTTKSDVNVKNTSDTDAYLRVELVSYRVNVAGERIGGTATVPAFTLGSGWVFYDGFYYYTSPVAPGELPATDLIANIDLIGAYGDADGGKQVIEVLAEAIQSAPPEAVGDSWGVTISGGTVSAYN